MYYKPKNHAICCTVLEFVDSPVFKFLKTRLKNVLENFQDIRALIPNCPQSETENLVLSNELIEQFSNDW